MFNPLPVYSVGAFATATFIFFLSTGFLRASAQEHDIGCYHDVSQTAVGIDENELREFFSLSEPSEMVTAAQSKRADIDEDLFETEIDYAIEEPLIIQVKETVIPKPTPTPTPAVNATPSTVATIFTQRGAFSEDDIFVLNKIVQAEAGGEPYSGKLSVTNVILNRHHKSGGTIRDVVFASNQFTPTANGAFDRAVPSDETKRAVLEAINGNDNSNGALYFLNESTATSTWVPKNRTYSHAIANHTFYK